MQSIMALVEQQRQHPLFDVTFDQFYAQVSGPYLDDERNKCVEWFLNKTSSTYLLFIDSDIEFNPTDVYHLIELAVTNSLELLGGVYYNAHFLGLRPVVYNWQEVEEQNQQVLLPIPSAQLTADDVMRCDAFGTGFMAIHRDLLIRMGEHFRYPTPWFAEVSVNNVHMGEDLTFCLRANELGAPPHIAPGIQLVHYKTCAIKPPSD